MSNEDRTSMCYWWPRVRDCDVPMPETHMVVAEEMGEWFEWTLASDDIGSVGEPPGYEEVLQALDAVGYPAFLRTDQASAKHDWGATCYVRTDETLASQMWALFEFHVVAFLPRPTAWVVREYIQPASTFRAHGPLGWDARWEQMPVGRERRYFVRDGEVECHHPYWHHPLPRVSRIVQTPAFIEELLSKLDSFGWEASVASSMRPSPLILNRYRWAFDLLGGSDMVLKRYEKLGLAAFDAEKGQQNLRYLGCLLAVGTPTEEGFTVLSRGPLPLGFGTTESFVEKLNALNINLLDADAGIVMGIGSGRTTVRWSVLVDGERSISIEEASAIGEHVLFIFHAHSISHVADDGNAEEQVLCTAIFKGPHPIRRPSEADWRERLAQLNEETDEEIAELTEYAETLGAQLSGWWSIDFMQSAGGVWYFIDAAEGDESWHPEDCPYAPQREEQLDNLEGVVEEDVQ